MKKSDIAIYISAILTLMLTTFVVFSTQKVTYETQIDDIIKKQKTDGKSLTMATDAGTTVKQDTDSGLFRTKIDASQKADNSLSVDKKTSTDNIPATPSKDTSTSTTPAAKTASQTDAAADLIKPVTATPATVSDQPVTKSRPVQTTVKPKTVKRSYNTARSTVKSSSGKWHVVKWGDTLWKIAARYNTSTVSLIRCNSLRNPNLIYPGMKIKLP